MLCVDLRGYCRYWQHPHPLRVHWWCAPHANLHRNAWSSIQWTGNSNRPRSTSTCWGLPRYPGKFIWFHHTRLHFYWDNDDSPWPSSRATIYSFQQFASLLKDSAAEDLWKEWFELLPRYRAKDIQSYYYIWLALSSWSIIILFIFWFGNLTLSVLF